MNSAVIATDSAPGPILAAPSPDPAPSGTIRALWFSRGRGHGHALMDLSLSRHLPGISPRFVSYATGADTFARQGTRAIDLRLPEANAFYPTLTAAHRLIAALQPQLVISREEFAALPAAHLLGVPALFLSEWLPPPGQPDAEALACASSIVIQESPGIFPVPGPLRARPLFLGPVRRAPRASAGDRDLHRERLGLGRDARVILVSPGGWYTEDRAPLADLLLPAFAALELPAKRLLWLAGKDHRQLSRRMQDLPEAQVLEFVENVDEIVAASDLVITKGTRGATLDAGALGVPSLSISWGTNPVDELLVPRIRTNQAFSARALDPDTLAGCLRRILAGPKPAPLEFTAESVAASAIMAEIRRLLPR